MYFVFLNYLRMNLLENSQKTLKYIVRNDMFYVHYIRFFPLKVISPALAD